MKVFISWSGDKSKDVAAFLAEWIKDVLQGVDCWYSPDDIEKGSMWFSDISNSLEQNNVGIICITPENMHAPWILFEAGALFKGLSKARVCPLLIGNLETSDITPPLSHFNLTLPVKQDMLRLLRTINSSNEHQLDDERLEKAFDRWWPEFEGKYNAVISAKPKDAAPKRSQSELLTEILDGIRHIQRTLPATKPLQDTIGSSFKSPAVSAVQEYGECTEAHQKGKLILHVLRDTFTATGSGKFSPEMRSPPYVNATLESSPDGYSKEKVKIGCNTGTTFDFHISLKSVAYNEPVPVGEYVFRYEAVAR